MFIGRLYDFHSNDANINWQIEMEYGVITIKKFDQWTVSIEIVSNGDNGISYHYSSNVNHLINNNFKYIQSSGNIQDHIAVTHYSDITEALNQSNANSCSHDWAKTIFSILYKINRYHQKTSRTCTLTHKKSDNSTVGTATGWVDFFSTMDYNSAISNIKNHRTYLSFYQYGNFPLFVHTWGYNVKLLAYVPNTGWVYCASTFTDNDILN
jgi:hypothetical protein